MRKEKEFTLEKLKTSKDISADDCQNLFDYAKVLYELEKYTRKYPKTTVAPYGFFNRWLILKFRGWEVFV
jgi:hypothetical protein